MRKKVLIIGTGITGLTCAQILSRQGWEIDILGKISHSKPTLVLNNATCQLLQNIWDDRELLLAYGHILEERGVSWGNQSSLQINREPGISISGNILVTRLLEKLQQIRCDIKFLDFLPEGDWHYLRRKYDWILDAGGRKTNFSLKFGCGQRWKFGQRHVISTNVLLSKNAPLNRYWIESISNIGWLFLAPIDNSQGILQIMIPQCTDHSVTKPDSFLSHAQYISPLIQSLSSTSRMFPAFPCLTFPFCGNGWLAVGDSAISLDPLSGDGTGYGLRGAILASSILNAVIEGERLDDCLNHYKKRLACTFITHLDTCFSYYQEMFTNINSQWRKELNLMKQSIVFNLIELANSNQYKFHLEGFNLRKTRNPSPNY